MPQFFISSEKISNNNCIIDGEDYHHLKSVRRIKPGDEIIVTNEQHERMKVAVRLITESHIEAEILYEVKVEMPEKKLHLYISLLKGKNFDVAIQKAVEVGVTSITPIVTDRTIPKIDDKLIKKNTRWCKIVEEAAKQSLRPDIPEMKSVVSFEDILDMQSGVKILAHPHDSNQQQLRNVIQEQTELHLLIGPEGGFSKDEIDSAVAKGWQLFNFGFSALRAETAAAVLPALCIYEFMQSI